MTKRTATILSIMAVIFHISALFYVVFYGYLSIVSFFINLVSLCYNQYDLFKDLEVYYVDCR